MQTVRSNVLLFGGGAAGLWTLDRLRAAGISAILIESQSLGQGQTIAAQGILHSGLKYSLQGLLTASAREAREMPGLWRKCLEEAVGPDLAATEIRSQSFYLWGTSSASSKLGMLGARLGLQVTPQAVSPHNAPVLLKGCPGAIFRVDEQVISCGSFLKALADTNREQIVHSAHDSAPRFVRDAAGKIVAAAITLADDRQVTIEADWFLFTAGQGNAALRAAADLASPKQQLRPLHMVMLKGGLPEFYGHCVDGAKTRVSITSMRATDGETVWQIGGQLAEDGVALSREVLLQKAKAELLATLPGICLAGVQWSTYRVDRAEGTTLSGGRPESFRLERDGNLLTAWPTKLVLVPQLAATLVNEIQGSKIAACPQPILADWPQPSVARAPWDRETEWTVLDRTQAA